MPNANPASTTLSVTFTVTPSKPASLGVSAQGISLTALQGSWSRHPAITDPEQWGRLSDVHCRRHIRRFLAEPLIPRRFRNLYNSGNAHRYGNARIPGGTYSGAIAVAGGGITITTPVTLSISQPSGVMVISQNALTFNAVSQGGVPLPQVFSILNSGQGSMNWTAAASTLSGGGWAAISHPLVERSHAHCLTFPRRRNRQSRRTYSGTHHYGKIANCVSGCRELAAVLDRHRQRPAARDELGAQVYPTGLIFTGVAGANSSSQDVMIANTAAGSNSYQSAVLASFHSCPPMPSSSLTSQLRYMYIPISVRWGPALRAAPSLCSSRTDHPAVDQRSNVGSSGGCGV